MQLTSLQTIFLLLPSVLCATYYVAPTGSDSAAGTLAAPYKSIQVAVDKAVAGDSILLRGGTYSPSKNIQVKKSGTASSRIVLAAYQSEVPVVDGEALTGTPAPVGGSISAADRGILHVEKASYWTFRGIHFINGPYGVYAVDSNNNVFQQLTTRQNYETGFQLQGNSANNQILYLDSYENRDPRKNGESADGIGIKEGTGEGNLLKGARLWNNVDDGLDLWEFKSKITIVDTISWGNGVNVSSCLLNTLCSTVLTQSSDGASATSRATATASSSVAVTQPTRRPQTTRSPTALLSTTPPRVSPTTASPATSSCSATLPGTTVTCKFSKMLL